MKGGTPVRQTALATIVSLAFPTASAAPAFSQSAPVPVVGTVEVTPRARASLPTGILTS